MKKEDFLKVVRGKAKADLTEQEISFFGSIGEAFEQAFESDKVERNKLIDDITAKLGETPEGESIAGIVRKQAAELDNMKVSLNRSLSVDDKLLLRKKLTEKKDDILRAMRSKDRAANSWAIEFHAARAASAKMTSSTIVTGAQAVNTMNHFEDLEVTVFSYPKNFIIDALRGRQVADVPASISWKEQNTESTSALGLTVEGGEKKITDKSFVKKYAEREKYTGRIEFTEELANDFDQLLITVIDMFEDQVIREWNAGVFTKVMAYASDYTSTNLDHFFVYPNVSQVIQAGKLWVTNRQNDPDILLITPDDAAKARISQNVHGDIQYLPDAIAFHGLTPIESTLVPTGKIYIGTSNSIKEQHGPFIMRRGMYGDQLIHNEETIIGEIYSLVQAKDIKKSSWIELDVATMLDTLTKGNA